MSGPLLPDDGLPDDREELLWDLWELLDDDEAWPANDDEPPDDYAVAPAARIEDGRQRELFTP